MHGTSRKRGGLRRMHRLFDLLGDLRAMYPDNQP
ncbi:hypothetical protein MAR_032104 [Mya arenaria]|uniref:Uncharacterized protein n=1 Tax=Mya arenaria TaxID=6604 RepID=A0ABY7F5P6_MYAAR|nr:hypothetical protein MAR_032104 [Mya arenaria]